MKSKKYDKMEPMLKTYNTLSQKKEAFKPLLKKKVNIFVCGPTVYDFSHIGHARTYVIFDAIVSYLKEIGLEVFYLQNITDIDDKIIKRANEQEITPEKLSRHFEEEYYKDMKDLKVESISKYARATDYIPEIISQVKRLQEKGYAYQIEDGVYYDISKFKDYGKLSGRKLKKTNDAVSRIDESKNKRNKGDFCLWKLSKPGEPKWKSPFGEGRPGWHIEDTAITEKHFGCQYDIHGGARDLIFPHHEAEISQMEALCNKEPMSKYWLHTGFLRVNGKKMSKSLGNFITIREFLKSYSSIEEPYRLLRFLVLKSHYRSPINYSKNKILQTKKELERIEKFINNLEKIDKNTKDSKNAKKIILNVKQNFQKSMDDDFNTPKAIAAIFDFINKVNSLIKKDKISTKESKEIIKTLKEFDKIFKIGLGKTYHKHYRITLEDHAGLKDKIQLRKQYREKKDWQKADEIRKEIEKLGYEIEDTENGTEIKKID